MLKKQAKAEKAEIQWRDEVGVRSEALGRCFSLEGRRRFFLDLAKVSARA